MLHRMTRALIIAALAAFAAPAGAQDDFPTRQITMVVPLPAGGTADILARIAAEQIKNELGQNVVVENRAGGGGGLVGAETVFRAPPDGYTILCAPQLTFGIANVLNPKVTFDTLKFEPISILATYPTILLVRKDLPVNSLQELIAYAKANPGKLNYGSQGIGQIGHLAIEQLKHMAKIDMVHVPFRGSAPAITALLGGQIDVLQDLLPATKAHIDAGKIKLLATGGEQRLKVFPDKPAMAEVLPGYEAETWMGVAAPPGTPKAITRKISDAIRIAFRKPEVKARIDALNIEARGTTPEETADYFRRSVERWSPLIKAAGIAIN